MRVALAHDYLREYGGAERVLEALHEMFPQAPVYTAYFNPKAMGENGKRFKDWDIKTSWFQKVPFANKLVSPFRILAPLMFESFDLSEFDLVISSSAVYFAKSVITKPETLHISYIHTPPRFLYGYTTSFNYKKHLITRIVGEIMNHSLRIWDFELSQRPDILVGNSKNVVSRINKFYRREAIVIYPPVDIDEGTGYRVQGIGGKKYFLALNRLVRGKGTEVIVKACSELSIPLKVVGYGPELESLQAIAGKTIQFVNWVSDEERLKLLSEAKALIVASEDEDFGITAVEAQGVGTPVIAALAGGYLETVIEGKTGEFYTPGFLGDYKTYVDLVSVKNLIAVLKKFNPKKYKAEDCRKNAERFSKERFKKECMELVEKNLIKSDN